MTTAPARPVPVISIAGPPLASATCLYGDCGWSVGPLEVAQVTVRCAEHQYRRGHSVFARAIEDVLMVRPARPMPTVHRPKGTNFMSEPTEPVTDDRIISTTSDTERVPEPDADEHQGDDQADADTVARLLLMA